MIVEETYVELTRNELEDYLRQMGECVTIRIPRIREDREGYFDVASSYSDRIITGNDYIFEDEYTAYCEKINWKEMLENG